ncbi:hypothetical protein LSAT2_010896 [Lamellibrachia satsuma]|nr:hypothetical protein LSAT2_010896 [Lamellibrachia satsuma]
MTHPNDIVATGEDCFYFTNYYKCDFIVEFFRGLSVGNVGLYDGRRGHILLAGISCPNGINTSPDGKYVYMSELGGKRLSVYIRESDNSLTLTQVAARPVARVQGEVETKKSEYITEVGARQTVPFVLRPLAGLGEQVDATRDVPPIGEIRLKAFGGHLSTVHLHGGEVDVVVLGVK